MEFEVENISRVIIYVETFPKIALEDHCMHLTAILFC